MSNHSVCKDSVMNFQKHQKIYWRLLYKWLFDGAETTYTAIRIAKEIGLVWKQSNFELSKWQANSTQSKTAMDSARDSLKLSIKSPWKVTVVRHSRSLNGNHFQISSSTSKNSVNFKLKWSAIKLLAKLVVHGLNLRKIGQYQNWIIKDESSS